MLINTKWMCCRASLSQLISRSLNRSHNQHHILIPWRLVNIAMRSNLARRVLVRFLKEIKLYLTVLIRLIRITNMLVTESLRMTAN